MNSKLTKKLLLTAALFSAIGTASLARAEGDDLARLEPGTIITIPEAGEFDFIPPYDLRDVPSLDVDPGKSDRAPTRDDSGRIALEVADQGNATDNNGADNGGDGDNAGPRGGPVCPTCNEPNPGDDSPINPQP